MNGIKLFLGAVIAVAGVFVLVWKRYGTSEAKTEKLREQIYELEKEKDEKYRAMQNALDSGYINMFYTREHEWLLMCKALHRLHRRLKNDKTA